MSRKNILFSAIVAISIGLDQLSKWLVIQYVSFTDEIDVIPGFLSIVHAKNKGAAFSALSDFEHRMWVFAAFTVVAVGVLIHTLRELEEIDGLPTSAVALLLGGAVGNAIDRLLFQEVTVFVRMYTEYPALASWLVEKFGTNTWPIWNIADACIVVGVVMFLIQYLFFDGEKEADVPDDEIPDLSESAQGKAS